MKTKPCPTCNVEMSFDPGQPASHWEPEQPPAWYCDECGFEDYEDLPDLDPDPPEADFEWPDDGLPF